MELAKVGSNVLHAHPCAYCTQILGSVCRSADRSMLCSAAGTYPTLGAPIHPLPPRPPQSIDGNIICPNTGHMWRYRYGDPIARQVNIGMRTRML